MDSEVEPTADGQALVRSLGVEAAASAVPTLLVGTRTGVIDLTGAGR